MSCNKTDAGDDNDVPMMMDDDGGEKGEKHWSE